MGRYRATLYCVAVVGSLATFPGFGVAQAQQSTSALAGGRTTANKAMADGKAAVQAFDHKAAVADFNSAAAIFERLGDHAAADDARMMAANAECNELLQELPKAIAAGKVRSSTTLSEYNPRFEPVCKKAGLNNIILPAARKAIAQARPPSPLAAERPPVAPPDGAAAPTPPPRDPGARVAPQSSPPGIRQPPVEVVAGQPKGPSPSPPAAGSPAAGSPAGRAFRIQVDYRGSSAALASCARALSDEAATMTTPAVAVEVKQNGQTDLKQTSPDFDLKIVLQTSGTFPWRDLARLAYIFQSPEHFAAFQRSALYRDSVSDDNPIAIAYGGFFHLFSARTAFTEPKHFYGQWVGGARYAEIYNAFNATMTLGHAMSIVGTDEAAIQLDVQRLQAGGNGVDAIEAPLIESERLNLGSVSRFVNLTYSAVQPVYFAAGTGFRYLPPALAAAIKGWIASSAVKCSTDVYNGEKRILADLQQHGVTVVPVDRNSFLDSGYRYTLIHNQDWSADELDALVKMGPAGAPARLPSSLLPSMAQKVQEQFKVISDARHNQQIFEASKGLQDRFDQLERIDQQTLAAELRAMDLPWPRPALEPPRLPTARNAASLRWLVAEVDRRGVKYDELPLMAVAYLSLGDQPHFKALLDRYYGSPKADSIYYLRDLISDITPGIWPDLARKVADLSAQGRPCSGEKYCELGNVSDLGRAAHVRTLLNDRDGAMAALNKALDKIEQFDLDTPIELSRYAWELGEVDIANELFARFAKICVLPGDINARSDRRVNPSPWTLETFGPVRKAVYRVLRDHATSTVARFEASLSANPSGNVSYQGAMEMARLANCAIDNDDLEGASRAVDFVFRYRRGADDAEASVVADFRRIVAGALAGALERGGNPAAAQTLRQREQRTDGSVKDTGFQQALRAKQWTRAEQMVKENESLDALYGLNHTEAETDAYLKRFEPVKDADRGTLIRAAANAGDVAFVQKILARTPPKDLPNAQVSLMLYLIDDGQ